MWPFSLSVVIVVLIAAAGVAAFETDTVSSYWQGLRWSISLITTVGFIGQPPHTVAGAIVSVILMVLGFIPLAQGSASLAALFVRDEERPRDERETRPTTRSSARCTTLRAGWPTLRPA